MLYNYFYRCICPAKYSGGLLIQYRHCSENNANYAKGGLESMSHRISSMTVYDLQGLRILMDQWLYLSNLEDKECPDLDELGPEKGRIQSFGI